MSDRKDCFLSIKSGRVGSRSRTTQTHYFILNLTYFLLNKKQVVFILEIADGNILLREARRDPEKAAQRTKGCLRRRNPCTYSINLFSLIYFSAIPFLCMMLWSSVIMYLSDTIFDFSVIPYLILLNVILYFSDPIFV